MPENALFGHLFGHTGVDRETGPQGWLQALLDVERALAAAQAATGLVPPAAAAAIAGRCSAGLFDATDIGEQAAATGNPVVPLVRALRALLPAEAGSYVHLGATSQDILDTAMMLVTRRALRWILADLRSAADRCAELAAAHSGTVMAGRTLLQQALPITFGLKCAGWMAALDHAHQELAHIDASRLAVQFGGAAGTLASLDGAGATVAGTLAAELGLAEPVLPWHTDRSPVAGTGCALGVAAGVLAKIALDVLLLAQTEVGEVREGGGEGHGGSSALPHKRNPVGAVLVTACARRVPALVATLLGVMAQEHERGAGGWHAEWETLTEILRLTGGAAGRCRELLANLRVDTERMSRNLAMTEGAIMAESVVARLSGGLGRGAAADLVTRVCAAAATGRGQPVRQALLADPAITRHLSPADLDAALDPASYLGCAEAFTARALARHAEYGRQAAGQPRAQRTGRDLPAGAQRP